MTCDILTCAPAVAQGGAERLDPAEAQAMLVEAIVAARLASDRLASRIAALDLPALSAMLGDDGAAASLLFEAVAGFAAIDFDVAREAFPSGSGEEGARLLGLIAGGCRQAVAEAYRYARARETGGKAIAFHQAVALRLAELAMAERAVSLLARATVAGPGTARETAAACRYIATSGARIAREAVQVAAGHGFVSGLPFAGLFSGLKDLAARLALHADTIDRGEIL